MNAERLGDFEPLDTPARVAQGFRETVQELQQKGKLTQPTAIAFGNAAVAMIDAIRDKPEATQDPATAIQLMNQVIITAVMSMGIADAALKHSNKLN